jgi:Protein of unknown function (DUF3224)
MTAHASGTFKVRSWDEETYTENEDGGKLTRASVTQAFAGDIEGDGNVEWLMCYRPDKTADFVGLQRVSGQLGERSGSFVLRTEGVFDGTEAKGDWTVVAGSGTGELRGLRGTGAFSAPVGPDASLTLDYDFE